MYQSKRRAAPPAAAAAANLLHLRDARRRKSVAAQVGAGCELRRVAKRRAQLA